LTQGEESPSEEELAGRMTRLNCRRRTGSTDIKLSDPELSPSEEELAGRMTRLNCRRQTGSTDTKLSDPELSGSGLSNPGLSDSESFNPELSDSEPSYSARAKELRTIILEVSLERGRRGRWRGSRGSTSASNHWSLR